MTCASLTLCYITGKNTNMGLYKYENQAFSLLYDAGTSILAGVGISRNGFVYFTSTVSTVMGDLYVWNGVNVTKLASQVFVYPHGVAVSPDGATVWVSDAGSQVIFKYIVSTGAISVFAGSQPPTNYDGIGTNSTLQNVIALKATATTLWVGTLYSVRRIDIATAAVTTAFGCNDCFVAPQINALDVDENNLYIADSYFSPFIKTRSLSNLSVETDAVYTTITLYSIAVFAACPATTTPTPIVTARIIPIDNTTTIITSYSSILVLAFTISVAISVLCTMLLIFCIKKLKPHKKHEIRSNVYYPLEQ